uniref:Uncharacterized protein n=1 Tax=Arundo donax TaxID=35708 RepID=A0A0A9HL68_ARUDO
MSADIWVMPAEGGVLGFLILSDFSVQLWKRETDSDDVARWVLGRTIDLDNLLLLSSDEAHYPMIFGFAEDDNVLFIWTTIGIFTIQLESIEFMQFKEPSETHNSSICHPFAGVYTAGMPIDGGH